MTRVTEIFDRARNLRDEQRDEFLGEACAGDTELRAEVESLLEYDRPETLTNVPSIRSPGSARAAPFPWSSSSGRRRIAAAALTLALVSAVAGWVVGDTVAGQRRDAIRGELEENLRASVSSYTEWIESWKQELERWTEEPDVHTYLMELVRFTRGRDVGASTLRALDAHQELEKTLSPLTSQARVVFVNAFNRENLCVFFSEGDWGDAVYRLTATGGQLMIPVFNGKTVVSAPQGFGGNVVGHPPGRDHLQIITLAPVHDHRDEIFAAFILRFNPDPEITEVVRATSTSRADTYAFDSDGMLVSHSRNENELARLGLLPAEPDSAVRVVSKDPGGDMTQGYEPNEPRSARPLTKMAASATKGQTGIDLDGYRDLRGKSVVGAWQWLPDYRIGIATEIPFDEAYSTVIAIRFGFGGVASLLFALAGFAIVSTVSLTRERPRVLEAERLGHYQLEEPIGKGGMATIYRARHAVLERPVAIKLLHSDQVASDSLARFRREVKLVSRLKHRNTIQIFDYGQTSTGSVFFVMELVQGVNLSELVRAYGALDVPRAISITSQICGSLQEAHHLGIVHRDIKPENVMLGNRVDDPDSVKVLDFGLARTVALNSTQITRQHLIGGTPVYIAPERIEDPGRVDPRSDIYSLGAVVFYLLTGRELIEGGSPEEVLMKTVHGAQARPSSVGEREIPRGLDDLVFSCLAKDPDDRPRNMDAIVGTLKPLQSAFAWTENDARDWWKAHGR